MPGGDGTGPAGLGPMTGRAAGYCAGYEAPGFISARGPWSGGWGRGGGGWGRRNWFYATGLPGWQRAAYGSAAPYGMPYGAPFAPSPTREQELNVLKGQAEDVEDTLNRIKKRIEELEAKTEK